jgi:hypothetical protein
VRKTTVWILSLILVSLVFGLFLLYKNSPGLQKLFIKTKSYTNSFYHFKLDIPDNWITKESVRSDGVAQSEIISANKEMEVSLNKEIIPPRVDEEIPQPDVQLGQYKAHRIHYVSGNSTIDYITTPEIPNQRSFVLTINISKNFNKNNGILLNIFKTFAFTQKELPITSHFTYILPKGWKFQGEDYQSAAFTSADYQTDKNVGYVTKGVMASILRYPMPLDKTLLDVVNNTPDKVTEDTKPFVLDGLKGFTRHYNWESHSQAFLFSKDKFMWQIYIITKDLSDENDHRQEIDSFVNSIKFK